jgi:hypothetical protein
MLFVGDILPKLWCLISPHAVRAQKTNTDIDSDCRTGKGIQASSSSYGEGLWFTNFSGKPLERIKKEEKKQKQRCGRSVT